MPIKLIPPRKEIGQTNYYGRGTYLGVFVNKSTRASRPAIAKRVIAQWEREIERGRFENKTILTFTDAAVSYMDAGGERRTVAKLIAYFKETPMQDIGQVEIDAAAQALFPSHSMATRNREVYSPMSAILKRAGIEKPVKRPKGWRGNKSTSWLEPEQAFALFAAADRIEPEFGLFLRFLCYTGMRLSEALDIELRQLKLDRAYVYLPDSKNGEPRGCHLPPVLVHAFATQPPRPEKPIVLRGKKGFFYGGGGRPMPDEGVPFLDRKPTAKLFRYYVGGALRDMLKRALKKAGLSFPRRQGGFHIFCHTYGSWMHRFGGLDAHGLTDTGRWADPNSAWRYVHTAASEEARRSDLLPTPDNVVSLVSKTKAG